MPRLHAFAAFPAKPAVAGLGIGKLAGAQFSEQCLGLALGLPHEVRLRSLCGGTENVVRRLALPLEHLHLACWRAM